MNLFTWITQDSPLVKLEKETACRQGDMSLCQVLRPALAEKDLGPRAWRSSVSSPQTNPPWYIAACCQSRWCTQDICILCTCTINTILLLKLWAVGLVALKLFRTPARRQKTGTTCQGRIRKLSELERPKRLSQLLTFRCGKKPREIQCLAQGSTAYEWLGRGLI